MNKVTLKTWDELKDIVVPEIMNYNSQHNFFILIHKDGEAGSIYPQMIKYLGEEIEVEDNINPNTYVHKEYLSEEVYLEHKIRDWMIKDLK